jgi:hypothetical protein
MRKKERSQGSLIYFSPVAVNSGTVYTAALKKNMEDNLKKMKMELINLNWL